jgi:hypothetical protein
MSTREQRTPSHPDTESSPEPNVTELAGFLPVARPPDPACRWEGYDLAILDGLLEG